MVSDAGAGRARHVRPTLGHPAEFYIGGQWVPPHSRQTIDVIEPSSEELLYSVAEADEEDISYAVEAARHAFDVGNWPRLNHAERGVYLRRLAESIEKRATQLASIQSSQMGVLFKQALTACTSHADTFRYYAGLAETFGFEERHQTPSGGVGMLIREPVGVVAAVIPWNAPMGLISAKLAPALLAGCTVIIKASPEAPGEAWVMAEIVDEAGLPPGVVNVVMADREVSESLVRDVRVDKVSFTGSTAAGHRIGAICGQRIARVTLELGGKSAAIVFDDFNIDLAAERLAASACRLTGQVCASLTRVIVSEQHHNELLDAIASRFASVVIGDPFDDATEMGPLATRRQLDKVERYVAQAVGDGARLAGGGSRPPGLRRGFYFEPTVFGNVDNSSIVAQEEIFGPVLSIIPARDMDAAIDLANDSIYGLNASVFTNDDEQAYRVARRLRTGTVGQNGYRCDFNIAFGGFKQSGIGREGGNEGLLSFLEAKTLILDG